jgi:hypothetical protein
MSRTRSQGTGYGVHRFERVMLICRLCSLSRASIHCDDIVRNRAHMGSEHLGLGGSGPARLVAGGLTALPAGSSLYVVRATVINNPNVGLTVAKGRGGPESQWSLHGASSPWWQEQRRIVTE